MRYLLIPLLALAACDSNTPAPQPTPTPVQTDTTAHCGRDAPGPNGQCN